MLKILLLCLFLSSVSITGFCGDVFSAILESHRDSESYRLGTLKDIEINTEERKDTNFVKGNRRWFKSKKDHMKFTPQKGIQLGKKVALNASIGVIWIYEPGLLLAEELVSPCFGIIFYYPNVQVSLMKGDKFLGVLCDAREHKPVSKDRFKWYIAVGNDLTFTPRYYVKEGAYIKEGQEIGHLSKPAKSVGRVAIKSRARCSGIIILCKPGLVHTGEEFLRISCDVSSNPNGVHNPLTDETHTSLLDQSDLGKSIPKLRGLAQVSIQEANYDGNNVKLPQVASLSGQSDSKIHDESGDGSELISEFFDNQEQKTGNKYEKNEVKINEMNVFSDTVSDIISESETSDKEKSKENEEEEEERKRKEEEEKMKEKEKEKKMSEQKQVFTSSKSHRQKDNKSEGSGSSQVTPVQVGSNINIDGLSSSIVGEADIG